MFESVDTRTEMSKKRVYVAIFCNNGSYGANHLPHKPIFAT